MTDDRFYHRAGPFTLGDIAGNAASLAFWRDNASKGYKGSGAAIPPHGQGAFHAMAERGESGVDAP